IIGFQTVTTANGSMSDDPRNRLAPAVSQKVEQVRQVAGERFGEIELSLVMTVVLDEARREAAERFARERGGEGISAEQILEMPSVFIGSGGGSHRRRDARAPGPLWILLLRRPRPHRGEGHADRRPPGRH